MAGPFLVLFGILYLVAAVWIGYEYASLTRAAGFDQILIFAVIGSLLVSGFLLIGFGELLTYVKEIRDKISPRSVALPAEPPPSTKVVPAIYEFQNKDGSLGWSFNGRIYGSEQSALRARSEATMDRLANQEPV